MPDNPRSAIRNPQSVFSPSYAARYRGRRFGGAGGAYVEAVERAAVLDLLAGTKGRLLDLACGEGRGASYASEVAGIRVVACDGSLPMLRRAGGLPRCQAQAARLPFGGGSFDAVLALRFLHHIEELRPVLAEVARVLKPGGIFVFDHAARSPRGAPRRASGPPGDGAPRRGIRLRRPADLSRALAAHGLVLERTLSHFAVAPGILAALGPFGRLAGEIGERFAPPSVRAKFFGRARRKPAAEP